MQLQVSWALVRMSSWVHICCSHSFHSLCWNLLSRWSSSRWRGTRGLQDSGVHLETWGTLLRRSFSYLSSLLTSKASSCHFNSQFWCLIAAPPPTHTYIKRFGNRAIEGAGLFCMSGLMSHSTSLYLQIKWLVFLLIFFYTTCGLFFLLIYFKLIKFLFSMA